MLSLISLILSFHFGFFYKPVFPKTSFSHLPPSASQCQFSQTPLLWGASVISQNKDPAYLTVRSSFFTNLQACYPHCKHTEPLSCIYPNPSHPSRPGSTFPNRSSSQRTSSTLPDGLSCADLPSLGYGLFCQTQADLPQPPPASLILENRSKMGNPNHICPCPSLPGTASSPVPNHPQQQASNRQ